MRLNNALSICARTAGVMAIAIGATACQLIAPPLESAASRYLQDFNSAEAEARTFVPITEAQSGTSMADAYELQRRVVAKRVAGGDKVAGYKGGLMSAKSLADRGVREPVTGVLFASGGLASGADVNLCRYRRAAFEMKIGYVLSAAVTGPVTSVNQLRSLVGYVQPVVELPDIAYRDDTSYGAIDMVAANVSSALFVLGARQPPGAADLNDLTVSMSRNGESATRGRARESLGEQWESLRTVVNLAVATSGRLAEGSLILTGKIGDKGNVIAGDYVADYGALGSVVFQAHALCTP